MDILFGGNGGGCGDPRCEACSGGGMGGGMGGFMPPFPFPGLGMPPFIPCGPGCTGECQGGRGGGGGGGFPGPMPGGMNFPGFPPPSGPGGQNFPGPYPQPTEWPGSGPGNFTGPGDGGGGGVTTTEAPFIYPLGATGQRVNIIIDTGASMTIISASAYNKHFRGIPVRTDKRINIAGVDGGLTPTNQRFTMPLTFNFGSSQATVEGEAWIRNIDLDVECLLGLPYLRANHMSLEWGKNGEPDSILVQGNKIPIDTEVRMVQYLVGKRSRGQRRGRLIRVGGKRK
ncbi:hypothetical protein O988_02631 [Pseudogymnoascus sp. VKM F-3808]|nr:hypothetical protein O988_02631 [Pseudogymnoascus sp. VKM F-3808]